MTSRTRIEKLQRTLEKIERRSAAGVWIIAPDADGGFVLTCGARQKSEQRQARFPTTKDAEIYCARLIQARHAAAESTLIIIDV